MMSEYMQLKAALSGRNFATADEVLAAWGRRTPEAPALYVGWCERFAAEDRGKEALEAIDKALALDPEDGTWHAIRADRLADLKRMREAEAALAVALSKSPRVPRVLGVACRLALIAKDDRLLGERAAMLREVLPTDPYPYCVLGGVALRAKALGEAEDLARTALRLAPEDGNAHALLAHVLLQRDRPAEAAQSARRAQALRPLDPGIRSLAGKAETMAKHDARFGWIGDRICARGPGPVLAAVVASFALFGSLWVSAGRTLPEWTDRPLYYCGILVAFVLFFVLERHVKRAKPDPTGIRIDPDY